MLSFEEKKAIFHSFKLKEKKISNGRVSFVYPESVQKGQVLATQLHPSGNGYVIGKYMTDETVQRYGYKVDSRGWISIKVFSKEEIAKVITEAMKSMAPNHNEVEQAVEKKQEFLLEEPVIEQSALESEGVTSRSVEDENNTEKIEAFEKTQPASPFEMYPGSCLFAWLGLTLSTMEYGFSIWQRAVRKYAGLGTSQQHKDK